MLRVDIKNLQHEVKLHQQQNRDRSTVAQDVSKLDNKLNQFKILESLVPKLIPNANPESEGPLQHPRSSDPTPGTNSQLDSDFGFTVTTVTLERDSLSDSYTNFSMEKFALNNVLHGGNSDERDPLRENPKPNSLRYFHFPANNMIWVGYIPGINIRKMPSTFRSLKSETHLLIMRSSRSRYVISEHSSLQF